MRILGFIMLVMDMSSVPFLITFVLAPMLEKGMHRSLVFQMATLSFSLKISSP